MESVRVVLLGCDGEELHKAISSFFTNQKPSHTTSFDVQCLLDDEPIILVYSSTDFAISTRQAFKETIRTFIRNARVGFVQIPIPTPRQARESFHMEPENRVLA